MHLPNCFSKGAVYYRDNSKACQGFEHQDNKSVCLIPHYTPLLYGKTGEYRGILYYLIFALKHILWVLVRTTSMRRF